MSAHLCQVSWSDTSSHLSSSMQADGCQTISPWTRVVIVCLLSHCKLLRIFRARPPYISQTTTDSGKSSTQVIVRQQTRCLIERQVFPRGALKFFSAASLRVVACTKPIEVSLYCHSQSLRKAEVRERSWSILRHNPNNKNMSNKIQQKQSRYRTAHLIIHHLAV